MYNYDMKALALIVTGVLILLSGLSLIGRSNIFDGTPGENIIKFILVAAIVGLFFYSVGFIAKLKLNTIIQLRKEYLGAYLCYMRTDLTKPYILVADKESIKILSYNRKKNIVAQFDKKHTKVSVVDVNFGRTGIQNVREQKGMRIEINPEFSTTRSEPIDILLLDPRFFFTPQLEEPALSIAVAELAT